MITRLQLRVLYLTAVALWLAALKLFNIAFTWESLTPYGSVLTVLTGLIWLFDRHLWKFWPFNPFLTNRPDISGTWEGTLSSNFISTNTDQTQSVKICYLRIYQTFSKIELRLMTEESSSEVILAGIEGLGGDRFKVAGVYINQPKPLIQRRSPVHHGAVMISVNGSPPISMEGSYWTDRETRGELIFKRRNRKLCDNFQLSQRLFEIGLN